VSNSGSGARIALATTGGVFDITHDQVVQPVSSDRTKDQRAGGTRGGVGVGGTGLGIGTSAGDSAGAEVPSGVPCLVT
jgi:hypothetical protein